MKIDKNIDDIIREFSLEILENKEHIKRLEQKNKEKEAFLKVIKSKVQVKYSELYYALENETSTYWKVKEVFLECRKNSFFEIKVYKKYFFSTAQIEIIESHYMLKFTRTKSDIRITQFY
jgi:hypothetical protein